MKFFFLFVALTWTGDGLRAQFGELDPTFSDDGIVQTAVELPSIGNAVAVQADGRILVAGNADSTGTVVRYMPDGSLDASFGSGGIAVLHFQSTCSMTGITVLSNGKIIVIGKAAIIGASTTGSYVTARLNSNGSVDLPFGTNGTGYTAGYLGNHTGTLWDVLVQPNGRILTAGTSFAGISTGTDVIRLLGNGNYDQSFGSNGGAVFGWVLYSHTNGRSIELQADGKVLMGGWLESPTKSDRFVRRLTAAGELDSTYASNGLALLDAGDGVEETGTDLLLQDDGKLLLVGSVSTPGADQHFRVTRLLEDGTLDASYGTAGEAIGPALTGTIMPQRGCLQADGKLVFITNLTDGGGTHSLVWRLNTDGSLDPTFGSNGQVLDVCGSGANMLNAVVQQADGKLVITGQGPGDLILTAARLSSGPVGVQEVDEERSITLVPNPNDGRFTVQAGPAISGTIVVIDALGRVVRTLGALRRSTAVELMDLPAGRYLLRVMDPKGPVQFPFVKY